MKIVFMGTPDFAVPCLRALLSAGHEVCGVFTQPDRPKGRGYALMPPPVKELALEAGVPVYQPDSLRSEEVLELLTDLAPELIAVVAYGKILPESILSLPKYGCVNVHGSLLPKYRGAAPIQWSVLNGDKITGVTTMFMAKGLDTGDILLTEETEIGEDETSGELYDRLCEMGARLLLRTIEGLKAGEITPRAQDDALSCYAPMLDKSLCPVDWTRSAQQIHDQIRGLSPWPVATTTIGEKVMKLHRAKRGGQANGRPGELVSVKPMTVCCGDGYTIELTEVQYSGAKKMDAAAFLRGHPFPVGTMLGEEPQA